ncbi:transcriptional regulator [Tsukamurella sp. 1534]|uniref:winged helix-turn-helix domain-containing protein n=1 Tax=Tsukamurella sp. 1534 TaxID=1151061 RepID=UPI0002D563C9|nr:transcriptional regulator [Tsukamurella sp. 1534]
MTGTPGAQGGTHARHRLDEVIHAPVRFSIVAALAKVENAEFAAVRDTVEVSDSVLSKQAAQLEAAGYVKVKKGYVGKRPRTWLSLTARGRRAFEEHLAALRAIAGGA